MNMIDRGWILDKTVRTNLNHVRLRLFMIAMKMLVKGILKSSNGESKRKYTLFVL